jgi:hypothetical protein
MKQKKRGGGNRGVKNVQWVMESGFEGCARSWCHIASDVNRAVLPPAVCLPQATLDRAHGRSADMAGRYASNCLWCSK